MIAALTNHLWQSTLFVLAAAMLAFALRTNGAHVRHAIWTIASLKFLLPFSWLIALGQSLPSLRTITSVATDSTSPDLAMTVDLIAHPFAGDASIRSAAAIPTPAMDGAWMTTALAGVWLCGFVVVGAMRLRGWLRIRAAVRSSTPLPLTTPIPVRSSPGLLEPGVVGIVRPVMLLPQGIEQRLTPQQIQTIVAHELCHVRRRDNLTAAMHMIVEGVFWFHPLVWWVGARLVDERERACDEYVLSVCGEPQTYAESIVNVCKFYTESPLACVSGVTGSDLKRRIAAIMANRAGLRLNLARRAALVMAAVLAIVLPIVAGMVTASAAAKPAPARQAAGAQSSASFPKFDVVSIKPCEPSTPGERGPAARTGGGIRVTSPGRLYLPCFPLSQMVREAYLIFAGGRVSSVFNVGVEGGPDWIKTERYEIDARTEPNVAAAVMRGPMLQALLEDRFKLKVRRVTREMPIYELVIGKSGAKVAPYTGNDCVFKDEAAWPTPPPPAGQQYCRYQNKQDGDRIVRWGISDLKELASILQEDLDRPLVNATGITAPVSYRIEYSYSFQGQAAADRQAALFAALRNQLGLDVRPSKGPRDFLVIDSAERPRPNEAFAGTRLGR